MIWGAADAHRLASDQPGHGEGHRDTVVVVGLDRTAADARATVNHHAVARLSHLDPEPNEALGHRGDPVALFDAQLLAIGEAGGSASHRRRDRQGRELVDRTEHGLTGDLRGV